ncbi:MAG: hypothetical protein ACKVQJ_12475 [Pyrinomonadaceae bacterium]
MTNTAKDPLQAEFEALPLEKKIEHLMKMEAVTISETFAYVVNSAMKTFEKVGESIGDFGVKVEKEARKAAESTGAEKTSKPPKAATEAPKPRPAKKPPQADSKM